MNDKTTPAVPQYVIPAWLQPHVAEIREWPAPSTPRALCEVKGCKRDRRSLGLCGYHYCRARIHAERVGVAASQWVASGGVASFPPTVAPARPCWVAVCDRDSHHNGLCKAHFNLARHHFRAASGGSVPDTGSAST